MTAVPVMLRRASRKVLCQAPTALLQALVFLGNVKLHASPFLRV
jgi:hypothetical protein